MIIDIDWDRQTWASLWLQDEASLAYAALLKECVRYGVDDRRQAWLTYYAELAYWAVDVAADCSAQAMH